MNSEPYLTIECFFGRLKIRFRILRSRILFNSQRKVDNVFHAACIMHNMLLKDDGLDEGWDIIDDEDDDLRDGLEARRIRLRLDSVQDIPNLPDGVPHIARANINEDDDEIDDSHYALRTQLIEHYIYAKAHKEASWLRRSRK